MRPLPSRPAKTANHPACDLAFLILAAIFAWLVFEGIIPLSGNGAVLDSDLQTYAQGMAGAALPHNFAADPVLHATTPANSIPNLERCLGQWLTNGQNWAAGLLKAGAIAIFVFYAGWYLLGRWLYSSPALAALLAVLSGITVWTGWGTFWGVLHSDPVPRVFFAAILPFLLLLALLALQKLQLRPLAMLACGLAMWVHGVSALNCGAMFFTAFLLMPVKGETLTKHIVNLALCLLAFFMPVICFLWPTLTHSGRFSPEDLALFQDVFSLRWQEDYGKFAQRMWNFFSFQGPVLPVLLGGVGGWLVAISKGGQREKLLCHAAPCFVTGILLVATFCWLETRLAPLLGRQPMGHELVRGMRFLVPIAWLLTVAGIGCLSGKILRRLLLVCALCAVLIISRDRQYLAAQYAIARIVGIEHPAAAEAASAAAWRTLLVSIAEITRLNEPIYCAEDAMQIRYLALRPLAHSFKDGYVHFYNKDAAGSHKWLELEKLARSKPDGYLEAWRKSGAPWLLCRNTADKAAIAAFGEIVLDRDGWLLVRKKG